MEPGGDPSSRPRAVLFPLPYQSHINTMLRLAAVLHARGLSITILHTETRAPDRRKLPVEYGLATIRDDVAPELAVSDDVAPFVLALNRNCAAPFREYLAGAGPSVACVVADVDWFAPLAAAHELGVPALALMTSSAARFRVYLAFQRLEEEGYLPVQECNLDAPVDDHPPLLARDLFRMTDEAPYRAYANLLAHMVARIRQSSGIIINTFDAIEGADIEKIYRDISVPVFAIGPLHMISSCVDSSLLSADRGCLEWLDAQKPRSVVYVSLGSLMQISAQDFAEMAWGLVDSKRPFLWVVRPNHVRGSIETSELPVPEEIQKKATGDTGRIVSWAPQRDVLKHPAVGAFLTHCGWNSTLESISEGVPMICRPLAGDQMGNARYVCDVWKVGTMLLEAEDPLERGDVRLAVGRVMDQHQGEELRQRMKNLMNAAAESIMEGGSTDASLQRLVDFIVSPNKM